MRELSESRILIVDDVKANIDVLVQALRDEYKLSVATSGEAALRLVEKNPPDLVLLDILMPGMDGYDVCRRLRAASATQETPVMFLSALEDVKNKAQGFEVGGNDYLTKPFEVLEVKARVRSLLKAKAYNDAVKEKIANELRIAREIQLGILPHDVAAAVRGTRLDVHAFLEPARQVGGDLYEVVRTRDGGVIIVVGDVSGKGIPAALFMAVTTTLIRTMAQQYRAPDEIVRRVSDALASHNPRGLFVTLFCAVFEPDGRTLAYACAAHPSPVLLRPGADPTLAFETTAMPAGIFPGMEVEGRRIELAPGDALVFYTDGITEAFDSDGRLFGDDRLLTALADGSRDSAAALAATLLAAVRGHAGMQPQSDDITVVTARLLDAAG